MSEQLSDEWCLRLPILRRVRDEGFWLRGELIDTGWFNCSYCGRTHPVDFPEDEANGDGDG